MSTTAIREQYNAILNEQDPQRRAAYCFGLAEEIGRAWLPAYPWRGDKTTSDLTHWLSEGPVNPNSEITRHGKQYITAWLEGFDWARLDAAQSDPTERGDIFLSPLVDRFAIFCALHAWGLPDDPIDFPGELPEDLPLGEALGEFDFELQSRDWILHNCGNLIRNWRVYLGEMYKDQPMYPWQEPYPWFLGREYVE